MMQRQSVVCCTCIRYHTILIIFAIQLALAATYKRSARATVQMVENEIIKDGALPIAGRRAKLNPKIFETTGTDNAHKADRRAHAGTEVEKSISYPEYDLPGDYMPINADPESLPNVPESLPNVNTDGTMTLSSYNSGHNTPLKINSEANSDVRLNIQGGNIGSGGTRGYGMPIAGPSFSGYEHGSSVCDSSPCMNSGTCNLVDATSFYCNCPSTATGPICETILEAGGESNGPPLERDELFPPHYLGASESADGNALHINSVANSRVHLNVHSGQISSVEAPPPVPEAITVQPQEEQPPPSTQPPVLPQPIVEQTPQPTEEQPPTPQQLREEKTTTPQQPTEEQPPTSQQPTEEQTTTPPQPTEEQSPCQSNPCINNGTCMHQFNETFYCMCPPTANGTTCENVIEDYCWKCEHGVCSVQPTPLLSNLVCKCSAVNNITYIGDFCDKADPCTPNPCLNNGTCEPRIVIDEYEAACLCATGWELDRCQDEDWCARPQVDTGSEPMGDGKGPCTAHATSCIDSDSTLSGDERANITSSVQCICNRPNETANEAEYVGKYCDEPNPCYNITCVNGKCQAEDVGGANGSSSSSNWSCLCNPGYDGIYCENEKPCPCQNGGNCTWPGPGEFSAGKLGNAYEQSSSKSREYYCCCPLEWFGENCTHESACHPNQNYSCNSNETCYLVVTEKWHPYPGMGRFSDSDLNNVLAYLQRIPGEETLLTSYINQRCNYGFYSNYEMEHTDKEYLTRDDIHGRACHDPTRLGGNKTVCYSNPCFRYEYDRTLEYGYGNCIETADAGFKCECSNCTDENVRKYCYLEGDLPMGSNCLPISDEEIARWKST